MLIHAGFDNQDNITIYPPSAMTANTTTINGQTYIASVSATTSGPAWNVFDYNQNTYWRSTATYTGANSTYGGITSTNTTSGLLFGEWVQLQVPNPINLHTFFFNTRSTNSIKPRQIKILGSNDVANPWDILYNETTSFSYFNNTVTLLINSNVSYNYFRVVVTQGTGQTYVEISEFRLYQDASTNKSAIIYNDASLYGRYKIYIIGLYVDSFNYDDTKNLLYISSPQLVTPGSNNNLLILQEVPVSDNLTKKTYHAFSDNFEITTELNGKIEVYFKRDNNEALFKKALLVMQAIKI